MKHYPNLQTLFEYELGAQAPSGSRIEKLRAQIIAENPTATHLVFFQNGHWILLPAGPDCPIKHPQDANGKTIPPNKRPQAYCKI